MIKLLLCSALCACSLMSAIELHSEGLRRAESVRELSEIVSRIISLLRFEAADVYELCRSAFEGAKLFDYSEFKSIESGDFPQLWINACRNLQVDDDSKQLFETVGKVLGSCDTQSQIERLSQLQAELFDRAKVLRERSDSMRRLYTTIGAMLGLGISIVII